MGRGRPPAPADRIYRQRCQREGGILKFQPFSHRTVREQFSVSHAAAHRSRSDGEELPPEEAINYGGADNETVMGYAVATTLRSSHKGEENKWWMSVPLTSVQTCAAVNPRFIPNCHKNSQIILRRMFQGRLASSTRLRPSSNKVPSLPTVTV